MRIFLVRHGDAYDGCLTPVGQEKISRTSDFLRSLGLDVSKTALLTSQLPRAVQTAEIIQKTLGLSEILLQSYLTCDTRENTAVSLASFTTDHVDLSAIIAVSHEPEIEWILYSLVGSYRAVRNGSVYEVEFQNRTVACLFVP